MIAPQQEQIVPVRVYQSGERLMAIMPLPGLEPPDISVTVRGDEVVVRGEYRGPHQQDLDLLIAEWAIGPYHREL
ncbi:MAG TPA: Hsp20/alpha crystallin family protein, partial [Chloroflexota bacterium]|nr:Hsp20/alpha crystallin family protein [Chloroflexota bacterium]